MLAIQESRDRYLPVALFAICPESTSTCQEYSIYLNKQSKVVRAKVKTGKSTTYLAQYPATSLCSWQLAVGAAQFGNNIANYWFGQTWAWAGLNGSSRSKHHSFQASHQNKACLMAASWVDDRESDAKRLLSPATFQWRPAECGQGSGASFAD